MPKLVEGSKYTKRYSEENVQKALEAVQEDGMSVRKAGQLFGVPRATIQFRRSSQFKNKTTLGPSPILTAEEEDMLEKWILAKHRKVCPRRKEAIQASVKDMLEANPRANPFKGNNPGDGWYKAYLKRHPNLKVTTAAAKGTGKDIRNWFTNIEEYLSEAGYSNILQDPTRIYHADETNFELCPKNNKVLAPREVRNVEEIEGALPKSNISVMFTFSAAGDETPPMVVYPYKRLPTDIVKSVPQDWGIGCTENGWMKSEVFYDYIRSVLLPALQKKGVMFPIILYLDGHSNHVTYRVSQLCMELNIILISLYATMSRFLKPAEISTLKPLKTSWKKGVLEFQRKNPLEVITKEKFAPLLASLLSSGVTGDTAKGFRIWGIYPWNPSAIDYSKCTEKSNKKIHHGTVVKREYRPSNTFLSWEEYEKIIGSRRLETFRGVDDAIEEDPEYRYENCFTEMGELTLYHLYRQFRTKKPTPNNGALFNPAGSTGNGANANVNATGNNNNPTTSNVEPIIHDGHHFVAETHPTEHLEFLYRPHPGEIPTATNNFVPGTSNMYNNNAFP